MSEQDLEIQRLREELAALSAKNENLLEEQARLLAEKNQLLTLKSELAQMAGVVNKLRAEKEEMQQVINDLRSMMAWFRKKLFGSMSEKHLPLDPNVLEPTLFDQHF